MEIAELYSAVEIRANNIEKKIIEVRRDLHQHPELANREIRTSKIVADYLCNLGIETQVEIAHTGVIGLLRGGLPGPIVALRADMDALPVKEEVDVPFASKEHAIYNNKSVSVMHACGHDMHTAILLGVAEVLAGMRNEISGTVKFIFQPAEEGPPIDEEGGAKLMLKEGVLKNPKPEVIFGLHVIPFLHVGEIAYRPGAFMASADGFKIVVHGQQTHGGMPWKSVDPIVVASQIVLGLQTITSRQVDLTRSPVVITVGTINGGTRRNIIPDQVEMDGTIRVFDQEMQSEIHERIKQTVEMIAKSAGAKAEVEFQAMTPVVYNDPKLTEKMLPALRNVVGESSLKLGSLLTVAEDFAYFQQEIPGMYFFVGVTPKNIDLTKAAVNHSPNFFADEAGVRIGIRAMANLALYYMVAYRLSIDG